MLVHAAVGVKKKVILRKNIGLVDAMWEKQMFISLEHKTVVAVATKKAGRVRGSLFSFSSKH